MQLIPRDFFPRSHSNHSLTMGSHNIHQVGSNLNLCSTYGLFRIILIDLVLLASNDKLAILPQNSSMYMQHIVYITLSVCIVLNHVLSNTRVCCCMLV